jgi:S1-C subfamily serine protease
MVMTIDRDGPGAAAGVRQGDVIVHWNGAPIRTVQALIQTLGSDSIGSVVALSILRAGEPTDLQLTIGERPQT